jgi:hypothetical protein
MKHLPSDLTNLLHPPVESAQVQPMWSIERPLSFWTMPRWSWKLL